MATSSNARHRAAWAAPAVVALAIGGIAIAPTITQAATPDLPAISAEQLLTNMAKADPQAFSGSVSVTSDLGLPDLSSLSSTMGEVSAASPLSLLTGTHTVKVWSDPATGERANIEAGRSEYSVVATKNTVWTYSSSDNAAVHVTIPASLSDEAKKKAAAKASEMPTPEELSSKALADIDPSTAVTIDTTASVAGRDCYQLIATPKDSGSLVASVRVAVDAQTYLPLRAQVYATANSAKPALESAFTSIDYGKPAASIFNFQPPKGADVQNITVPEHPEKAEKGDKPDVTVTGKGWASVVKVSGLDTMGADGDANAEGAGFGWFAYQPLGDAPLDGAEADAAGSGAANEVYAEFGSDDSSRLLDQLGKKVDGGMLFETNVFSVLVTDSGQIYAGAVPGSTLQSAAK